MRVRETPFPSIGLLPTVGTRLRRQATYSAQTSQCSASPCGQGRRGHRGSAAPRGLGRGGTAPAPARPAPPGPAHLQAVGAPQRREVAQRLGRARRVQIELPAEPLDGGAGIGGPRAGHGGGARAKSAGRAGPLPPWGRGRGGNARGGRRSRSPAVTRGHLSASGRSVVVDARGPFPRTAPGGHGRIGFSSAAVPQRPGPHVGAASSRRPPRPAHAPLQGRGAARPHSQAAAALPGTRGTVSPLSRSRRVAQSVSRCRFRWNRRRRTEPPWEHYMSVRWPWGHRPTPRAGERLLHL